MQQLAHRDCFIDNICFFQGPAAVDVPVIYVIYIQILLEISYIKGRRKATGRVLVGLYKLWEDEKNPHKLIKRIGFLTGILEISRDIFGSVATSVVILGGLMSDFQVLMKARCYIE
jgi:hypothetical protein